MSRTDVSEEEWELIAGIARDLVGKGVSHNLVRQAAGYYHQRRSAAALRGWLSRLAELGELFSSGEEGQRDRSSLQTALEPYLLRHPGRDWSLILGWTARMVQYQSSRSRPPQRTDKGRRR